MAESNVCSSCGAQLPEGVAFCGGCGAKVETASKAEVLAEANPLKKLLYVIWASIGISALSSLIGAFDVREYYSCGQLGSAVLGLGSLALSAWLAFEIAKRKNWARVTFMILGLLNAFMYLPWWGLDQGGGSRFIALLDVVSCALDIYCVVMLFTKKVSNVFQASDNGKKLAWTFWGVSLSFLVLLFVCAARHSSSEEYLMDCAMAAAKGSDEAYESLVVYCVENMEITGDEEEILQAAEETASAIIAEVCPDEQAPQTARAAKRSGKSSGILSGLGKYASAKVIVLAVLCILGIVGRRLCKG